MQQSPYAEESFKLWLSKISTINEIEIRAKRKFNCDDEDMKMEYEIPLPFSFLRKHFVPETGKVLGDITARTEDVLESLLHSNLQKRIQSKKILLMNPLSLMKVP